MRRSLILLALVSATIALAACSQIAGPTTHSDDCPSGYTTSTGRGCVPDSLI